METVSLSYFVDFVLRSGTPKLSGVREFKERKDELSTDFYRPIRSAIVQMHREGAGDAVIDEVITEQTDEKRKRIYPLVAAGYRKFLASGDKRWFEPPRAGLRMGGLTLDINPEVGFLIDGKPHLLKLYFRGEPLTPKRASVILSLLKRGLGDGYPGHVPAVLEVRSGRLFTLDKPNPRLDTLLSGEAASFATIYNAI